MCGYPCVCIVCVCMSFQCMCCCDISLVVHVLHVPHVKNFNTSFVAVYEAFLECEDTHTPPVHEQNNTPFHVKDVDIDLVFSADAHPVVQIFLRLSHLEVYPKEFPILEQDSF